MKRIILLIFAAIAFAGCEDVQDNTPAMQGSVNEGFFKATDAFGSLAPGSTTSYLLQGLNSDETLTLGLPSISPGTYILGNTPNSYASFVNFEGNIFSTIPSGDGFIEVTSMDGANKTVTGNFRFTAYSGTQDTLKVQRGVFYQVPYAIGIQVQDPGTGDGALSARVDGVLFEPDLVSADNNQINIRIRGAKSGRQIELRIPIDAVAGTYDITQGSYFGKYLDENGVLEAGNSGNITVIANNTQERTISGTFGFVTTNHTITLGQFSVSY